MGICAVGGTTATASIEALANEASNAPALTSFKTLDKASVRSIDPAGIRFSTEISASEYAVLLENYTSVEFGTLLVPEDLAGGDYTLDNENAHAIKRTVWDLEYNPDKGTDTYKYNGVLTNIYTDNYNRVISAIGYVTLDGVTYYANEGTNPTKRSPLYVASAAIAKNEGTDYLYTMVDTVMATETLALSETAIDLKVGGTATPELIATVAGNEVVVTYEVTNDDVATFVDGTLTAVSAGTTEIVATLQGKERAYTATCEIVVKEKAVVNSANTLYYDMTEDGLSVASTNWTDVAFTAESVQKVTIDDKTVSHSVAEGKVALTDIKTATGYENIPSNTGAKIVKIETAESTYILNTIFVNKIIRQSDITDGKPLSLDGIFYQESYKTAAGGKTLYGGYFVLGENITLSADQWHSRPSVIPLSGGYNHRFNGVFDGLGYSITNYVAGGTNGVGGAMLGYLGANAVVKNIYFANAKIGNQYAQGLIALSSYAGSTIENIFAEITIKTNATNSHANQAYGCLVGACESTIKNCIVKVNSSTSESENHGYIARQATNNGTASLGSIENCYAIATYTTTVAAGLVANNTTKYPSTENVITGKVFDNNSGTGVASFYADSDVTAAIANYSAYWQFDSTVNTIGMSPIATNIV